jgi:hypothetical protein
MGNVINVPIPSAIAARAVTPSVVMNSNVASAPTVALITLDHWMEAPFEYTDNDLASMSRRSSRCRPAKRSSRSQRRGPVPLGKHVGFYRRGRHGWHDAVQRR